MRVLVVGAGCLGAFLSTILKDAGREVVLLARGSRAEQIKKSGLVLASEKKETISARPDVATSLAEAAESSLAPFDCVLIAVKAYSVPEVTAQLRPIADRLLSAGGAVLPLSNGLGHERELASFLRAEQVIGGVANVSLEALGPNEVLHHFGDELVIGPFTPRAEGSARAVVAFLECRGLRAKYAADLSLVRWKKLVWNSAVSAVTALAGCTVDHAAKEPGLRALLLAAMTETVRVGVAEGVAIPERLPEALLHAAEESRGARTSMEQDAARGRPTEHRALNGTVVELGRARGVPTPTNQVMLALLEGRIR